MSSTLNIETAFMQRQVDTPIKRLMLAIVEDAIRCALNYRGATQGTFAQLYNDSYFWLFAAGVEDACAFSFETACGALEIEPTFLRAGIRDLLEADDQRYFPSHAGQNQALKTTAHRIRRSQRSER